jgi:uncharacterized membrane protein
MLSTLGRTCFAIALACFGVHYFAHLLFSAVPPPGGPWTSGPGFLEPVTAIIFLFASVGLMVPVTSRIAALVVAAIIFPRIIVFHFADLAMQIHSPHVWTNMGEILALGAGAFALVAILGIQDEEPIPSFAVAASVCFAISLVILSVQRFLYSSFVTGLIPKPVPFPRFWAIFFAVVMAAAALSLILHKLDRLLATLLGVMFFIRFCTLIFPHGLEIQPQGIVITSAIMALAMAGTSFSLAAAVRTRDVPAVSTRI